MAHATPAALVPCSHGVWNAGAGTGACVDDVSPAARSNPLLSDFDALANRNHSFRKLHVFELPGPRAGFSLARRSLSAALLPIILEETFPGDQGSETADLRKSRGRLARHSPQTDGDVEACRRRRDAHLDFLRDPGRNGVDGQATPATRNSSLCLGVFSHCQSLWALRNDD